MIQASSVHPKKQLSFRLAAYGLIAAIVLLVNIVFVWTSQGLRDFAAFVAAGRSAANGLAPYRDDYASPAGERPTAWDPTVMPPNLNPPFSVLLFRGLAAAEPHTALLAWRAASCALYLAALLILTGTRPGRAGAVKLGWALLLAGFWQTIELGQIYALLALAVAAAWRLLDDDRAGGDLAGCDRAGGDRAGCHRAGCHRGGHGRAIAAGMLIGFVLALKPNFVVWPACLFLAGYRRAGVAAIVTAGVLCLAPALAYGPVVYTEWLRLAGGFDGFALPGNASLAAVTARLGVTQLGGLLSVLVLAGLAGWVLWKKPRFRQLSGAALAVSLLASPIAWPGYVLTLVPAYLDRQPSRLLACSAALLLVPFPIVWLLAQTGPAGGAVFGSTYAVAIVLGLVAFVRT